MNATHSSSQAISPDSGDAAPAVSSAEIDASCRLPLLFLFVSAAVWLLVGSIFGVIATLKFHNPEFMAAHPYFTYGRIHPAHLNAFLYGFAVQAGLGVMLWIIAHLGRTRLAMAPAILGGGVLWNIGVMLGIIGILGGETTGFEWLEMPRYGSLTMFFGYLAIGVSALTTFHQRRERELYTSHWFLIAAVFWFPWIFSTGNYLLGVNPVRGALQAVVDWWYMTNLSSVWFGCIGIGAIFYFVPRMTKHPLYSHGLGLFAFWGIVIFGSWGGIAPGAPLPAWMSALSTTAAVLTIVPILTVALNLKRTGAGDCSQVVDRTSFKFICFGAMAFVLAGLIGPIATFRRVSVITNFTWFIPAQTQWVLYGFFAMTMFGAIYYIVPRITGIEFCSRKAMNAHFWFAALGIVIYVLPLALGGIEQGMAMNDKNKSFLEVMAGTLMPLRISTTGDFAMLIAHLIFLLNLAGLLKRLARQCMATFLNGPKPAGVTA
jgi:cytochrome c oxidase cbb3-type subunit 1